MRFKFLGSLFLILLPIFNLFAIDSLITDPEPKRYQNEIDSFKFWDKKNSFPKNAILFAGSSSIRIWETYTAFHKYPVINRGFGGAHVSDVIHYYEHIIQKYEPSVIVFYRGDNDIAGGKPVSQVFEDYIQFVEKIQKDNPLVKFIFISVKPSLSRWAWWDKMEILNQQIEQYNQKNKNLYYVDLASPLLNSETGKPIDELFLSDKLHLSTKGYEIWGAILSKLFDKLCNK